MKKESHLLSANRLLVFILLLALAAVGCSKKSNSDDPAAKPTGESAPTGVATPTVEPTATPTAEPTKVPSPTPTVSISIAYGDLAQYIGMKAGDLIQKMDTPFAVSELVFYTDEEVGHGMITFDGNILFALSSDPDAIATDKAPEGYVIAVQVSETAKAGALSLGGVFTSSMKYRELQTASGDALMFAQETYSKGTDSSVHSASVYKTLCKYTFTWLSEDPNKENLIPDVIVLEGCACRQLDNNAELYTLALEHDTKYLADLRSSYKDVTVRKGGYLGSFQSDKGTVEVYDSAVYGRPVGIDNNPDSETGFTDKPDPTLECYDYSLFFRTMSNGACLDVVRLAFPEAPGSNPLKTQLTITNQLVWYDGGDAYAELLGNSGITLKKTDGYYAVAAIRRYDTTNFLREAIATSYYNGSDNAMLLAHYYISVNSNNGVYLGETYYGPDGERLYLPISDDAGAETPEGSGKGGYLTNSESTGLSSVSWAKIRPNKDLQLLDVDICGVLDIEALYLVTENFFIPLYERSEPGMSRENILLNSLRQKNADINDELFKKHDEQYLAELRSEYKDVPVHKSGLLAAVAVTDDTTVEVYESAVYGCPVIADPADDAANGYTYTGVDASIEGYSYIVTARILKNGRYTPDYASTCVLYSNEFATGNMYDYEVLIVNDLVWSYKEDSQSAVTASSFPSLDSLPWTENETIDGSEPYIAVAGIVRRFNSNTTGYNMNAYYNYYNTAYYLGSDSTPILGRCYAQELFSYYSLGERITDSEGKVIYTESGTNITGDRRIQSSGDGFGTTGKTTISTTALEEYLTETWEKQPLNSKVNLITMTLTNSVLETTTVYSYLSCGDSNLVLFDLSATE